MSNPDHTPAPELFPPIEAGASPAGAFGRSGSVDISALIARDQLESLCRLGVQPIAAGLVFSIVVGVMLWPTLGGMAFGAWLAARVLISLLRIRDCREVLSLAREATVVTARRRRFVALMACECASWSAMGLMFTSAVPPDVALVMLTALVGVAAVSVFSLASDFGASGLFVTIVLLPNALAQIARGSSEGGLIGAGLLIFLVLLLLESRSLAQRMTELVRLRHANAAIAEQRQRALVLAEHSSQAKSRFLATVSHEIRTPLNGILGMAQLLQQQVDDPPARNRIDVVAQSARHLQTLISDLLDLSRIEAGRLVLDEQPVELRRIVREVSDLQSAAAADKGLRFDLRAGPELPAWVLADAARVKQVLHNLLGNAIKFTRQGEVWLAVELIGRRLAFTVRDTGPGVAPEMLERIFQPFEQLDQNRPAGETATSGTGLGLGLAICRHLAGAMGGAVEFVRPAPVGASFRFTMPCRAVPAPTPATAAPAATDPVSELPDAGRRLQGAVLVVEDNPVNAMIAQAMLECLGLEVEVAVDGLAALEALEARRFAAVLMDCQMPVLDGWQATRRWRQRETSLGRERLPIIALTANAVVGDRERCLAAGMDDYLAKPIELPDLGRKLLAHLGQPVIG